MGTHKTCKICEETKIIDDFYKSQRGLKCKNCTLQITREYKKNKRKGDSIFPAMYNSTRIF